MDFYNMQRIPKVAKDLKGNYENFSVPVLVFDEDDPQFCNIGYFNFDEDEWSHLGEESMKLICWCYIPDPTEFLMGKNFKSVKHTGYRE